MILWFWQYSSSTRLAKGEGEEEKEHEKTGFAIFSRCYVEIYLFFGQFLLLYVLDIDVARNGNNLKLKVKSEFSLSMGLMLINNSNPYIHSTKVLCDNIIVYII